MRSTDQMCMNVRHILLLLLDDLSDMDRCRLHFVLGEHIPRRLREWKKIENTIELFEYLIDTEKIFTFLIEGLSACGKLDWSEKLKAFRPTSSNSTIIQTHIQRIVLNPSILDELIEEEEDKTS